MPIDIRVGNTYFEVDVNDDGTTLTGINLRPFVKSLTVSDYSPRYRRWLERYRFILYNKEKKTVRIPRYFLDKFAEYTNNDIVLHPEPITPPRKINISMKPGWVSRENQLPIIDFLSAQNASYSAVSAQTGIGKTHCEIATVCRLKLATLVITSGLVGQWVDAFKEQTNIKNRDICVLQGAHSILKLWRKVKNREKLPSVIIASTRTLYNYAVYSDVFSEIPCYSEFIAALGIGIRCVDEVHLHFHANTIVDLAANIQHNGYLSATYKRNDQQERDIFNVVFPRDNRFGTELYRKYTTVIFASYKLDIPQEEFHNFILPKGYQHAGYESHLLSRKSRYFDIWFENAFLPSLMAYYHHVRRDNQRLLVLTTTKEFACVVAQEIQRRFNEYEVCTFFSGSSDSSGDTNNLFADIIVSTVKSSGTGRDIKNLKTCIQTISTGSEPAAEQYLGRLRELPNEDTFFVDLWDRGILSQRNHYYTRRKIYPDLAKACHDISY